MICPLCDNNNWRTFLTTADMFTGRPYTLVRCEHCDLVRTMGDRPFPSPHDLYDYGGSSDAGERFGPMQWILRAFRATRRRAFTIVRPGRVLDVGCGDGSFLMAMAQQGWDVTGLELSTDIAATASKRLGVSIHVGQLKEMSFDGASFDLITLWHVLEHLENPAEVLARVRHLVKADGHVVLAVPNIESWQARLFKASWLHLDVPRHRWHFSPRTLVALADRCKLHMEMIHHFSFEYGPFGMVQGLVTKVGLGHSLFTRLVRLSPSQLVRERLFWLHVPILALGAIPSLILEAIAALYGRGGTMVMVLRPK